MCRISSSRRVRPTSSGVSWGRELSVRPRVRSEVDRRLESLPDGRLEVVRMCALEHIGGDARVEARVDVVRVVVHRQDDRFRVGTPEQRLTDEGDSVHLAFGHPDAGDEQVRRMLRDEAQAFAGSGRLADDTDADVGDDLRHSIEPQGGAHRRAPSFGFRACTFERAAFRAAVVREVLVQTTRGNKWNPGRKSGKWCQLDHFSSSGEPKWGGCAVRKPVR